MDRRKYFELERCHQAFGKDFRGCLFDGLVHESRVEDVVGHPSPEQAECQLRRRIFGRDGGLHALDDDFHVVFGESGVGLELVLDDRDQKLVVVNWLDIRVERDLGKLTVEARRDAGESLHCGFIREFFKKAKHNEHT